MLSTAFSGGVGSQQNGVLTGLLPKMMGAGGGSKLDMRAFMPVASGLSYDPQMGVGGKGGLTSKAEAQSGVDQNALNQLVEMMRTMKLPGR